MREMPSIQNAMARTGNEYWLELGILINAVDRVRRAMREALEQQHALAQKHAAQHRAALEKELCRVIAVYGKTCEEVLGYKQDAAERRIEDMVAYWDPDPNKYSLPAFRASAELQYLRASRPRRARRTNKNRA